MPDSIISISTETTTVQLTTIEPVFEFTIPSQTIINGGAWGAIDGDINNQEDLKIELDLRELISNKATDLTAPDNIKYPSTLAIANALSLIDQALDEINSVLLGKQDIITNSDEITEGSINLFLTTAERAKLGNTSGINTGDQSLINYAQFTDLATVATTGNYSDLSGTPSFTGHHIQSNGNTVTDRGNLNFLSNITVTDNSGNNSTDISLDAYQLALDYTPENVDNKATNLSDPGNTTYPTTAAVTTEFSNYVPYTGASGNVNLGDHSISASNLTGNNTGDQDLSGLLVKSNNLSDLGNTVTARSNLGLGNLATQNSAVLSLNDLSNNVAIIGSSNIQITAPSTPVPPDKTTIRITALPSGNSGDVLTNNSGSIGASPLKTINGNSLLGVGNISITSITDHTALTSIGTNTHAQIDTDLTRLTNTSGTNTGDLVLGNSTNGLSLDNQTLELGLASGNTSGALSSTDWTTFNDKQDALTNPITGSGLSGQITYYSGATTVTGNSNLSYINNNLGINQSNPISQIDIVTSASTKVGCKIKGAITQASDLLQFLDSSGNIRSSFSSTGNLRLNGYLASNIPSYPNVPLGIDVDAAGTGFVIRYTNSEYIVFQSGGILKGMAGIGSTPFRFSNSGYITLQSASGVSISDDVSLRVPDAQLAIINANVSLPIQKWTGTTNETAQITNNGQGKFTNIIESIRTTDISYAVLIADKTIEVTTSGITITLLDTALTGQSYTIINASSGDITIISSTTKQIGNLPSGNPTTWTQSSNSSYNFKWTGTLWRIT